VVRSSGFHLRGQDELDEPDPLPVDLDADEPVEPVDDLDAPEDDVDEPDLDEPEEPEPDFDGVLRLDEPDDPEPVDLDPDEPEERVVEDCVLETCLTSFLAPSSTASLTSPTRLMANSLTVPTPSWTFGWFQTSSAALRICSYRSRPARVPST
jgi:hypothetical protein